MVICVRKNARACVWAGVYRALVSLDGDGRKVWLIHGGNEKLHV